MLQQHFAVRPSLAFFTDEVLDRNLDIVEVDFIHFVLAIEQDEWLDRDAGRLHVYEHEADTFLAPGDIGACPDKAEYPVRVLPQRGPCLGAIHDIVVAGKVGARLERRQVGACTGFGVPLGPPHIAGQDVGQNV